MWYFNSRKSVIFLENEDLHIGMSFIFNMVIVECQESGWSESFFLDNKPLFPDIEVIVYISDVIIYYMVSK